MIRNNRSNVRSILFFVYLIIFWNRLTWQIIFWINNIRWSIEIIKVFFYKQIQNEFQVDAIRYKDNEIQFYYQDFKQGSIPFEDSLYEQVSKQYPNLKQDVRIDFDWAVEAILWFIYFWRSYPVPWFLSLWDCQRLIQKMKWHYWL